VWRLDVLSFKYFTAREEAARRAQSLIVAQGHSTTKITPKVQSGVEIVSWRKGYVPLGSRSGAGKLNCQGYISLLMMSKEAL
jgi:hypothetical protein